MSVDLGTTYLGLKLRNPLVVSACPLSMQLYALQRLEAAGAAAAVLASLFEEQIGASGLAGYGHRNHGGRHVRSVGHCFGFWGFPSASTRVG